ncbi:MAG TPA: flippase activity-associated protein Agl23 [Clostridia bacterium]|nr:flippase activity-associated protein Agl23 [Clostridia bacterium]
MTRYLTLVLLLATGAALLLRWPTFNERPMHNDEAVNAIKFGKLWQEGKYNYDPNEHHGPSLYYASLALGRLTGAPSFDQYTDARLRLVTVLFGLGLLALLPLVVDGLGRRGTIWAAIFTAASPALVSYSVYYIHESLLVFSTFLALAAGWRYWRSRKLGWILLAGAGLGLMDATKETFVITLAAAGVAVVLNQAWNRFLDASGPPVKAPRLNYWHLAAGFGAWVIVAVLLFTSFFTNASGPLDSLRTYAPWINRAAGDSPHIHPWHFYLHRLLAFHPARGPFWTEALILFLAIIGAVAGFRRKRLGGGNASFVRFLALYSFLLTAIYSFISYKTPWCIMSPWHGMVLLAGVGSAVLLRSVRVSAWKPVFAVLLLAGAGHLAWLSWLTNTTYAADPRNPYIYAQTSRDIFKTIDQIEALAKVHPQGNKMLIQVMSADDDYWPLPWYLRRFEQVGWWGEIPKNPYAPVMIVSARMHANLDEKKTHLMVGYFELRPQVLFELYVELDLWKEWLAKRGPVATTDPE